MNDRLRQLYREASGRRIEPVAATPPPALPSVASLVRRLRQQAPETTAATRRQRGDLPGLCIAEGVQQIETRLPMPASSALQFDHAELGRIELHRVLAIDTETTGLAGGSGTRAFLVGLADWRDGALRVRQFLLTALAGEAALLDALIETLSEDAVLLSYNGKSFDLPLLRTRLRLHRRDPRALDRPHVDLLYGVRRRYRQRWDNCRLATAERELLQVGRHDDLPGSEAPAAFRRWLVEGDAEGLTRVAKHNAQDLVSLVQLAVRLGDERATPW